MQLERFKLFLAIALLEIEFEMKSESSFIQFKKNLRYFSIIPGVCALLTIDHENLQRSAAGFLCEMSVDRSSREIIYRENQRGGVLKGRDIKLNL